MSTSSSANALRLALVAHDAKKAVMVDWVQGYAPVLKQAHLFCNRHHGGKDQEYPSHLECDLLGKRSSGRGSAIGCDDL